MTGGGTIGIDEEVAFLRRPEVWPAPSAAVELVGAHLSLVFLVGDEVFKLKKPVRFGRQDLRPIEARRRSCETEVRLNRRLAPEVYLGVVPLTVGAGGALSVGGAGTPIDWMVHMRRLPADRFLEAQIRAGTVDRERLDAAAHRLVRFHLAQPPALRDRRVYVRSLRRQLDDAVRSIASAPGAPLERAQAVEQALVDWIHGSLDLLGARVAAGRVVEGHGDLRPEHVCLVRPPAILDCLEFDVRLRTLDSVDDLAFLALECERLGAPDIGARFLDIWRRDASDDVPDGLVAFHQGMRALTRASVAAMRLTDCSAWSVQSVGLADRLRNRLDAYLTAAEARLPGLRGEGRWQDDS